MTTDESSRQLESPREHSRFESALKWSFVMTWGASAATLATTLVLASILGPETFGLVTLANISVLFFQLILDPGVTQALIQHRELRRIHLDSCFWLLTGVSLFVLVGCQGTAAWWLATGGAKDYAIVFGWLALKIPLFATVVVHQAVLRRGMEIKPLAMRANLAVLAGALLGVPMALAGFGYWSLIAQQLAESSLGAVLIWRMSEWHPSWNFEWTALRELSSFSLGTFLSSLGIFAYMRGDAAVMGLVFGPAAVGIYRLAVRLMNVCSEIGATAVNYAALPELARHQNEPARLRTSTFNCLHVASTITISLLGLLASISGALMPLMGEQWAAALVPLRILCVMGAFQIVTIVGTQLLQAVGRPYLNAFLAWLFGGIAIAVVFIIEMLPAGQLLMDRTAELCLAFLAVSVVIHLPTYVYLMNRACGLTIADVARATLPSVVAAIGTFVVAVEVGHLTAAILPPFPHLLAVGAVAIFVLPALLLPLDSRVRGLARERIALLR